MCTYAGGVTEMYGVQHGGSGGGKYAFCLRTIWMAPQGLDICISFRSYVQKGLGHLKKVLHHWLTTTIISAPRAYVVEGIVRGIAEILPGVMQMNERYGRWKKDSNGISATAAPEGMLLDISGDEIDLRSRHWLSRSIWNRQKISCCEVGVWNVLR